MKKLIQAGACVSMMVFLAGCAQQCKVEPPQTAVSGDKQIKAEAAANALTTAISGASAGVDYHNVVNKTYVTVGQDDVAFYLLMQAYNCESARGNAAGAAEILRLAREELARRHDVPPPPAHVAARSRKLTKTEEKVLRKSPLKEKISSTLAAPTGAASPAPSASPAAKTKGKAKASPSPTP